MMLNCQSWVLLLNEKYKVVDMIMGTDIDEVITILFHMLS